MSNLVEIFFDTASKYPDHNAISYQGKTITYAELAKQALSTATFLSKKGVAKGSKVLVFIPMSIKLYQTVLALFSLGAIVVFVDEWSNRSRLKKALQVVPVDVIIAPRKYLWIANFLNPFRKIKIKIAIPSKLPFSTCKPFDIADKETALITFTTGSTGLPKAANRTHGFLSEQFRILKDEISAGPEDRCLITLPIVLLSILGTGATGVIAEFNQKKPELLDAVQQLELVAIKAVTMVISSPYYIERLAMEREKREKTSIRKILTGGAPVFPDLANKIASAFSETDCIVAYGSTEAEPISIVTMEEVKINEHGLSVGKIHEEIDLKIIKLTDGEVVLGSKGWSAWEADFGEIVVAGPHVLTSYFNSEEAFKLNKVVDGNRIWHRTGDSGCIKDGQLFLNGRCSQLIKSEQSYKSLFLIEYQLSQVPGVAIGTYLDHMIILELNESAVHSKVKEDVATLDLGERLIKIVDKIPRDPRHFSKIDYKKVLSIV